VGCFSSIARACGRFRGWLITGLLVSTCPCVYAGSLDSNLAELGHRSWTIRDGSLPQRPMSLAQTTDGFVWVGTLNGLLRFDGVGFSEWPPTGGGSHLDNVIFSLLSSPDGSLWIGTHRGVSRLLRGLLTNFPGEKDAEVTSMTEDSRHRVWVLYTPAAKRPLCRIDAGGQRCFGAESSVPTELGWKVFTDGADNVWIGGSTSVHRWKDGSVTSYPIPGLESNGHLEGVMALTEDMDGSLLVGIAKSGIGRGLEQLAGGRLQPFSFPGLDSSSLQVSSLLRDRHGFLWIGTTAGLYRLHDGSVDRFSATDGLSGSFVMGLVQDSEGSVWAVTNGGIDQFRETPVTTVTGRADFQAKEVDTVMTAHDGSLWVGGVETLFALKPGARQFVSQVSALQDVQVTTVFEDSQSRMWVGTDDKLNLLENGHLSPVKMADGTPVGMIKAMAEDRNHDLWAVSLGPPRSILRIDPERRLARAVPGLPPTSWVTPDPVAGLWLGLINGDLLRYRDGQTEVFRAARDGHEARIWQLATAPDGSVMASTGSGLLAWRSGKLGLMSTRNGLPCNDVYASVLDRSDNLWLYMRCGLVWIAKAEVDLWWEDPTSRIHPKVFDSIDGSRGYSAPFTGAARTADGRLWFTNGDILQVVDPSIAAEKQAAAPVYIESFVADGRSYPLTDPVMVPALTHSIGIGYTAPSFIAPKKIQFRYELEGFDRDSNEAGARRQAFYTQLPPGRYRFRVNTLDSDGRVSAGGASIDLVVAPAIYQTLWVRTLAVLCLVALSWFIFRSRVQRAAATIQLQHEARIAERERVARQIHDTFLQSVQAFLLRLSLLKERVAEDQAGRPLLEEIVQLSNQASDDVRGGIRGLRDLPTHVSGIAEVLTDVAATLIAHRPIRLTVSAVGEVRPLASDAYENVCAIGQEAIRNAVLHADATAIEVELRYSRSGLRLSVRDDGRGIDKTVLKSGREGHWGLRGMRERARVLRAKLGIVSKRNVGTTLRLVIPAGVVFGSAVKHWLSRHRLQRS
jgi:signal transduction histidine kinase/ligand-binding sensor domain-containing protein